MLFYRVKAQADQLPKNPWRPDDILVKGELYTVREYERLPIFRECRRRNLAVPKKYADAFEKIVVGVKRTYRCFGARFADEKAVIFKI